MILKRYGNTYHSVEPNFDARALTEIGFRRNRAFSIPAEEFRERYEKLREETVAAQAEGEIHDAVEQELLRRLEGGVAALRQGLQEGEVLVVESLEGDDYPKTRDRKQSVVVDGQNRFYFYWWVEPPLRLGVYREKR